MWGGLLLGGCVGVQAGFLLDGCCLLHLRPALLHPHLGVLCCPCMSASCVGCMEKGSRAFIHATTVMVEV